jgi:hypothetical protein
VKVHNITGPIFFKETVTYQYIWLILTPLFGDLTVEEETYVHLMVDSTISYTLNSSVAALEGMLFMQLIMHSLWPARFRIEYMLLFGRDNEIWSFCEQAALLLLKDTIQSKLQIFQDELHHISRYFQMVLGLFRR